MNVLELLIDFFSFQDANVRLVAWGTFLLGALSAVVGCFTFLRKKALIGDAISHAVLPGICLGFLLFDSKNTWVLLLGAVGSGWLSVLFSDWVLSKTKLKPDAVIGLTLSLFFGVGVLLLTYIQHQGNASQSGLDKFLFGKAASLLRSDLMAFGVVGLVVLGAVLLYYRGFLLVIFDRGYAQALGIPVRGIEVILSTLTVLAVAIGIQTVGVVLMSAMLITPAAAARFWVQRLRPMLILAAIIGAFSGLFGAFISYAAPNMPTGPWIVLSLSVVAMCSMLFAPKRGWYAKWKKQQVNRRKILEDNILKLLYKLGAQGQDLKKKWSLHQLQNAREFSEQKLSKGLRILEKKRLVLQVNNQWVLTDEGAHAGMRLVKIHRLWELYLTTYLRIAPDHVHEDAETIEHIITPELEEKLEHLLDYPEKDPHQADIPYPKRKNSL